MTKQDDNVLGGFFCPLNKSSQQQSEIFASAVDYTYEPAPDQLLMNAVCHVQLGDFPRH